MEDEDDGGMILDDDNKHTRYKYIDGVIHAWCA